MTFDPYTQSYLEKLSRIISTIYSDKGIQALLKKESYKRWLKGAREVAPIKWHVTLRRNWNIPRKVGRPRKVIMKQGSLTPICDEVFRKHREQMALLAQEREKIKLKPVKMKVVGLKKADKRACVCKSSEDHKIMKCQFWWIRYSLIKQAA